MKLNVGEMHSDLEQVQREAVMHEFKAGRINILVATDIVARGIDIDDIRLVINFDVPHDSEDYVHRIGRTARANNDGVALTFINEREQSSFKSIENFLEKEIYKIPIPAELGEAPSTSHVLSARTSMATTLKERISGERTMAEKVITALLPNRVKTKSAIWLKL